MVINSVHIGAFPGSLEPFFDCIDWVPIDILAVILVELALKRRPSTGSPKGFETQHADVHHPLSPHNSTWTAPRPTVLDELMSKVQRPMEIVPLRMWIAKVRKQAEYIVDSVDNVGNAIFEAAMRNNPAAKLLDFFEDLAPSKNVSNNQLKISETLKLSRVIQKMEPIMDDWVRKWTREWFTPATSDAV